MAAVNVSLRFNGGLLPDIILLTKSYDHRETRLNAMKRFCRCSLRSHLNVLTFPPLTGECSEGLDAFRFFFKQQDISSVFPFIAHHHHHLLYYTIISRVRVCVCVCVWVCVCVCSVVIPFILDVRLVDVPAGVTQEEGYTGFLHLPSAVCVCVFSSHPFWTSSSLDVPAGVTQEEGHTGFLIHLPSAVRALIFVARRIQPFLSLVDREVEFCVLTN